MDKLVINGQRKLNGIVEISGAKNAVLPVMVATLLAPGKYRISRVPNLRDTHTMLRLLEMIGAKGSFENNESIILCPGAVNRSFWLRQGIIARRMCLGSKASKFSHFSFRSDGCPY